MEETKIDAAVDILISFPPNSRADVLTLAISIANMTTEEREELERWMPRVERHAPKRIRHADAPPAKRRGRPRGSRNSKEPKTIFPKITGGAAQ